MLSTYIKSEQLKATILISFEFKAKEQKIKLDEVKFFEKEIQAIDYIKRMGYELVPEKDLINYSGLQELHEVILNFLSGKNINLYDYSNNLNIDLDIYNKFPTDFSQKVINNLMNLNRGEITTYFEIGSKMGSKAYRAIGNILRRNPLPLIIPCHRVIKKNGDLGGFMGESDKGWQLSLKRNLLKIEQITNP